MDRSSQISSSNLNYIQNYTSGKALTTGSYTKNMTADGQPETPGEWVESYRSYYDDIMNGTSELAPTDQDTFMQYWNWCMSELGMEGSSSSFGDDFSGSSEGTSSSQPSLPAGAIYGANGNIVYDKMDAMINHSASGTPIDIFSDNIEINSGSMMVTYTSDITTDTRPGSQLPDGSYAQVLRITASDGTVYFVHDFDNANITIRTPVQDMVDGGSPTQPNIHIEEYSATAASDDIPSTEPSYSGGDVEQTDTDPLNPAWNHYAKDGEPVIFNPLPPSEPGVVEHHTIYGDLTVNLRGDLVAVITDGNDERDEHCLTVYDKEGTKIAVYTFKDDNELHLNANANQVYVNKEPNGDPLNDKKVRIEDYDSSTGESDFWNNFSLEDKKATDVANGTSGSNAAASDPSSVQAYIEDSKSGFLEGLSKGDIQKLQDFVDSFNDPELSKGDLEDLLGNHSLVNEIRYGNDQPSQELLDFVVAHDDQIDYHVESKNFNQVAARLIHFLKAAGYSCDNGDADNANISVEGEGFTVALYFDEDNNGEGSDGIRLSPRD